MGQFNIFKKSDIYTVRWDQCNFPEFLIIFGFKEKYCQELYRECGEGTLNMYTVFIYRTKVNIK